MSEAADSHSGQEMTCFRCGSVQPQAARCKECGAIVPRHGPPRQLKGRARALAAASAGSHRGSGYFHWTAWVAYSVVLILVGALVLVHWQQAAAPEAQIASVQADIARQYPALRGLETEDPETFARMGTEIAAALQSGRSRDEAMAAAVALLPEPLRNGNPVVAVPQKAGVTVSPTAGQIGLGTAPTKGSESADLGALSAASGVGQLPARKCSGSGPDAECIDLLENPGASSRGSAGQPKDAATALEQLDAYRRKANESYEALKGL